MTLNNPKKPGTFLDPITISEHFTHQQGWVSSRTFPRELIDLNHDGAVDILGFGQDAVQVLFNPNLPPKPSAK